MEEITKKDWLFLVGLGDDYRGLHSIPFEYSLEFLPTHKMGDPIPRQAREDLEVLISGTYERLYHAGWVAIFLFDSLSSVAGTKLSREKSLEQIRNLKNYDYRHIPLPLVCAAISDGGAKILEKYRALHEQRPTSHHLQT